MRPPRHTHIIPLHLLLSKTTTHGHALCVLSTLSIQHSRWPDGRLYITSLYSCSRAIATSAGEGEKAIYWLRPHCSENTSRSRSKKKKKSKFSSAYGCYRHYLRCWARSLSALFLSHCARRWQSSGLTFFFKKGKRHHHWDSISRIQWLVIFSSPVEWPGQKEKSDDTMCIDISIWKRERGETMAVEFSTHYYFNSL